MLQRPNVVGLTLCEQVIIEEKTHNVTVVNSVSRYRSRTFPTPPQRFVVYAVLTDGMGEGAMSLIISRLDTLEDIEERHWRMRFPNPLSVVRLVFRFANVSFPVPGRYQLSLFADGEWVAQSVVRILSEEQ
jgi:hypothetical protein